MTSLGPGTFWKMELAGLTIIGKAEDSSYPEDMPLIERERRHGFVFGTWYSSACPLGEVGSNHILHLIPITENEFNSLLFDITHLGELKNI